MVKLIIGILLILFSIVSTWVCVERTPDHLQGWYGLMYGIIALGGLLGGIALILSFCGIF